MLTCSVLAHSERPTVNKSSRVIWEFMKGTDTNWHWPLQVPPLLSEP